MSNITEKQFKDWFFKNCTEKQGSELNPPKVSLAPYDLYKKLWRYFEAALQNKVSDVQWWEKEFLIQELINEGYDKTLAGNIVTDLEKIKNNRNENN